MVDYKLESNLPSQERIEDGLFLHPDSEEMSQDEEDKNVASLGEHGEEEPRCVELMHYIALFLLEFNFSIFNLI